MSHIHKYETVTHHIISPELAELGIQAAETRKCKKCGKETPFVQVGKGGWVPLYDDRETGDPGILLA